jgi:hypothetical protein
VKNFQCLGIGINVSPLLNAVLRNDLWNTQTLRTAHPESPHQQVSDIWLRFNKLPEAGQEMDVVDDHESINYPAWFALPEAQNIVLGLMRQVRGERLGRVLITSLAPGKTIAPHVDGGSHARYYQRFHVILQGLPGSLFFCGGETVQMFTGQLWWFDNEKLHECVNNSADDRIHMIVDIKTPTCEGINAKL